MLHIALATIAKVDILVSWNFKHIVHLIKSVCSIPSTSNVAFFRNQRALDNRPEVSLSRA